MIMIGQRKTINGITRYEKGYFRHGWIYKDEDAFLNRPDEVCYIPEFSYNFQKIDDDRYTGNDILKICNNNVAAAKEVFELLDWAHPETAYDELLRDAKNDEALREKLNL